MAWQLDKSHSHIDFTVRHMMIAKVRGTFEEFDVTVDFDRENPGDTVITAVIDAASINTRDDKRDGHLRSPDFLDVDTYPTLTFKSKRIEQHDESTGKLIGDLTIKDITNEVTLDVEFTGVMTTPWGAENAGFTGTTTINRTDWGLNWNQALEAGGWLVGELINISIDLELVKVSEQEAEAVA